MTSNAHSAPIEAYVEPDLPADEVLAFLVEDDALALLSRTARASASVFLRQLRGFGYRGTLRVDVGDVSPDEEGTVEIPVRWKLANLEEASMSVDTRLMVSGPARSGHSRSTALLLIGRYNGHGTRRECEAAAQSLATHFLDMLVDALEGLQSQAGISGERFTVEWALSDS